MRNLTIGRAAAAAAAALLVALASSSATMAATIAGNSPVSVIRVSGKDAEARGTRLAEALQEAVRLRQEKPGTGVTIELSGGDYLLSSTLIIGPGMSGTPQVPTRIIAAPGAHPRLSGARTLSPVWSPYREGIYRAAVPGPSFDLLYMNGEKEVRARYPNYDPNIALFGGYAADAISPVRVSRWQHPEGGILHALHEGRWASMYVPILGKNADGTLHLGDQTGNNRPSPPHPLYRFVENIFEELDAAHEWYYNSAESTLYFMPPPGTDPATAMFRASHLHTLIELRGTEDRPVHDIRIQGLGFTQTAQTFLSTTEPLLRSDWKFARKGALLIEGAVNVRIEDNVFHDLGGNAVVVSGFSRRVKIAGNDISDIGASGISFVGRPEAVRSPVFSYDDWVRDDDMDRTPGPKANTYPAQCSAEDNLIRHIGTVEKQVAGVEIAMAMNILVSHNTIYDTPRAGINIGDGTWGGDIVEYNDVFDTVLQTADHGAINTWGRARYWMPDRAAMERRLAKEPDLWKLDTLQPNVLRHNRFRSDHGWDIDLDDGSTNYQIYDNVCLAGGLKFREGFHREAVNNILVNNGFHPHVWFKDSGDRFEHNIVLGPYSPIWMDHWDAVIDHNLFAAPWMLAQARALGTDAHSLVGDPQFIDAQSGDYRVAETSPALRVGFQNFPMTDFGVTRPNLKRLARKPEFQQMLIMQMVDIGKPVEVAGGVFKSVSTLGDQSAAGLNDTKGVMVLSVDGASSWAVAGLRPGDVLLEAHDKELKTAQTLENVEQFVSYYQSRKWWGKFDFVIERDQHRQDLHVDLQR